MTSATDDERMKHEANRIGAHAADALTMKGEHAVLRPAPIKCVLVAWAVLTIFAGVGRAQDAAPQPTAATSGGSAGAAPRLPMLSSQGPTTKVEGKIARSSRGRKGPVRLLVERPGGDPVTVLVAADDYCDRVGLSLRAGETITAEGTMVKGERPILLASKITSDGKTVQVRDASGKLVDREAAGSNAARATFGGGAAPDDKPKDAKGQTDATKP
jgi:hypothetical protein